MASHEPDPGAPLFARGTTEFDRALAFFDGTYAVALTLLVTTLDRTDEPAAWADPAALWAAIGTELVAFFLAFTVVAFYWRSNHAFVARLHHLSGPRSPDRSGRPAVSIRHSAAASAPGRAR